jgi:hypothetical protein
MPDDTIRNGQDYIRMLAARTDVAHKTGQVVVATQRARPEERDDQAIRARPILRQH